MANIHRIRSNFKAGTLNSDLLTTVTTIDFGSDPGFATLGTDEYLVLIIDPEGAGNGPEIVYLTAYTATQTTGTIERGKEGTSDPGLTHASGTVWRHGPTAMDFDRQVWAQDEGDPSGVAYVDFDISGFEAVRVVGWLAPASDGQGLYIRFSNDGGSTFRAGASDYSWVYDYRSSSGATSGTGSAGDTEIQAVTGVGNDTGERVIFDFMVIAPSQSGAQTGVAGSNFSDNSAGTKLHTGFSGKVNTSEVNDAIRLLFASGNIASGRVVVYGFPAP